MKNMEKVARDYQSMVWRWSSVETDVYVGEAWRDLWIPLTDIFTHDLQHSLNIVCNLEIYSIYAERKARSCEV